MFRPLTLSRHSYLLGAIIFCAIFRWHRYRQVRACYCKGKRKALSFSHHVPCGNREDYKRHRDDEKANSTPVLAFDAETKTFRPKPWRDVRVGEILKVKNQENLPSDL